MGWGQKYCFLYCQPARYLGKRTSPPDGATAFGNFFPPVQFPANAQGQEQKAVLDMMYLVINDGKANNYDLYRQQFTVDPEMSGTPEKSLFYGLNSTFPMEII
jgi:hypothetical protein